MVVWWNWLRNEENLSQVLLPVIWNYNLAIHKIDCNIANFYMDFQLLFDGAKSESINTFVYFSLIFKAVDSVIRVNV